MGANDGSNASSENARNFTFVLASQAALTLRTITNGSEHMFKRSLEMLIGNICPISSLLREMKGRMVLDIVDRSIIKRKTEQS